MEQEENARLNYCFNCMRRLGEGETLCPDCGYDNSRRQNPENTLPEGTILAGKYFVGKMLGQGGFGITYLGLDLALNVPVAIKEYFPVGVGIRSPHSIRVTSISTAADPEDFRKGCDEFQSEAQTLARFNSPNIVHVRDYFRENGTAYIIMDYVRGNSLTKEVSVSGGKIPWERVVSLFEPLILELDKLHKQHVIHRDIKPDNLRIAVDESGAERLVLLDFGAARSFLSAQVTKTYTAMVTPGFAPLEQYSPKSRQGPYTDVYALCATMYAAISGVVPAVATDRVVGEADLDNFRSFDLAVPETVEAAITHGLAVKSADRPQSMAELYQELTGEGTPGAVEKPVDPIPAVQRDWNKMKRVDDLPERPEPKKSGKIWLLVPLLLILATGGFFVFRNMQQNQKNTAATQDSFHATETMAVMNLTQDAMDLLRTEMVQTQEAFSATQTQAARPTATSTKSPQPTATNTLRPSATTAPSLTPTASGPFLYTVQEGDNCWSIISKFGVPLDLFLAINNLPLSCPIVIGQELVIPAPDMEMPTATPNPLDQYTIGQQIEYTVEINDSYPGIAAKFNTTLDSIQRLNDIEDISSFPTLGQTLIIAVNLVTPTPSPVPTYTEIPMDVRVGDIITFGKYEQDNDLANGPEPIEWQVLDVENGRALLISKYGLDNKPYNEKSESVTWEKSTLRKWLNGEFYVDTFNDNEKEAVLQVLSDNPDNLDYKTKS